MDLKVPEWRWTREWFSLFFFVRRFVFETRKAFEFERGAIWWFGGEGWGPKLKRNLEKGGRVRIQNRDDT